MTQPPQGAPVPQGAEPPPWGPPPTAPPPSAPWAAPAPGWVPPPGWGPPVWGQPVWGQAGWSAPPPPRSPRSRALRRAAWGVAALAALALVVAAVVVAVRGFAASSAGSDGTLTASPQATRQLLGTLPAALSGCAGTDLAGDGDDAAADCAGTGAPPAPDYAMFYRYREDDDLFDAFTDDVGTDLDDGGFFTRGLSPAAGAVDCAAGPGAGDWQLGTGSGHVACGFTEDDEVLLVWTDDQHRTEGFLYAPGTTQDDVAALYSWWQASGQLHD